MNLENMALDEICVLATTTRDEEIQEILIKEDNLFVLRSLALNSNLALKNFLILAKKNDACILECLNLNLSFPESEILKYQICPQNQDFFGYVRISMFGLNGLILKLEIPKDSKSFGGFIGRACKTNKCKILGILDEKGNKIENQVVLHAFFNKNIVYKLEQTIEITNFNESCRSVYTEDILFYLSFEEAQNHGISCFFQASYE